MTAQKPDLVVVDSNDRPILAVEVVARKNLTVDEAIDFRKEVLPHLGGAYTRYLIFATQDYAYYWEENDSTPLDVPPSAIIPMASIVKHYRRGLEDRERLSGGELELIVWHWLLDLVNLRHREKVFVPVPAPLKRLLPEIAEGDVRLEAAR